MKQSNLKIASQINIWLTVLIVLLAGFVVSTFFSLDMLWQNTKSLYEHPLTVRRAVGDIEVDVLYIHNRMLHLVQDDHTESPDTLIAEIDALETDIYRQLDILYDRYLGPMSDLDAISASVAQWSTIRAETIRLYHTGDLETAQLRVEDQGVDGAQTSLIMENLIQVSAFAMNKGDTFFNDARTTRSDNLIRISLLSVGVLIIMLVAGFLLRRGILPPLTELTNAADSMRQGKLDARVRFRSRNELGTLSASFNSMAGTIQSEMAYRENLASITTALSATADLRSFCQQLLKTLIPSTDSQMGAVYLLEETRQRFVPFESLGAVPASLRPFANAAFEGEFGYAVTTQKIRHITDIPEDVPVVFSSVSGDYRAKEIITIPILNGSDVVAVVSLASIKNYSRESIRLIEGAHSELSARIAALIGWQRILEMSERLQRANQELQQQSKELEMQTSELTEQNTELELQKKQLDEASRLKTNFLSNMSHELRTPLNSVIALTGVLRRRLTNAIPAEEFSYLEVIERNGKALLSLINDILDISRIEAGREVIEIEPFSVHASVRDLIDLIMPQAEQKGISLTLDPSDDVRITSDADKFRHIMQNLIGNAVKFTEQGGVRVAIRAQRSNVSVTVTDTGIGVSKEELPHIFDEFRQADGSTSRRFGGAGLGLAISKKYADLLGGIIQVKSTPGQGSEFTLTLPLETDASVNFSLPVREVEAEAETTSSLTEADSDFSQKTVLLVEDNESAIIQMQDLVGTIGCRVQTARNAEEAFQIIAQAIPDAMILDLMMPDVDGFKVLETLRNAEITAHVPVLILTAKQISKDELHFLKRNNIHQLIQKGDVNVHALKNAITGMFRKQVKPAPSIVHHMDKNAVPTVLIVEDNPDNMTTIKALLTEKFIALGAPDAKACFELLTEHSPDVILMDIALPDISGIDAFHQIRKLARFQKTPVIALTASVMRQDRERILAHGFNGFIPKPIDEKEFHRVINEVLYGK
ncbi:MAG: hybrid sensor histidine kinase/response regulator [Firmicutes bacterium HGW-Firmicutes-9]|jgi:signal transduction histidine kinase/DNA-binding response OmpR family regulator/HAMP domain-containing protein|nr:MAG: hybrid sensor histidine kinase/response regulator [Firmicutes bacterium HGW-Firmicutes-9]